MAAELQPEEPEQRVVMQTHLSVGLVWTGAAQGSRCGRYPPERPLSGLVTVAVSAESIPSRKRVTQKYRCACRVSGFGLL